MRFLSLLFLVLCGCAAAPVSEPLHFGTCGTDCPDFSPLGTENMLAIGEPGPTREVEVVLVYDEQYVQRVDPMSEEWKEYEREIFQAVNDTYLPAINVILTLKATLYWEEDPYPVNTLDKIWGTNNSYDQSQLIELWAGWATKNQELLDLDPDVAILVTGKLTSSAGLAYLGSACRTIRGGPGAESINENAIQFRTSDEGMGIGLIRGLARVVLAHEVGHCIGMGHDAESGFIMSVSVNDSVVFSEPTKAQALNWLASDRSVCIEEYVPPVALDFIRGDVDRNGKVEMPDAILLMNHVSGVEPIIPCRDAGDVNDDGAVSIADAVGLLNYLFSNGAEPKAPFPELGPDPTADTLGCEGQQV